MENEYLMSAHQRCTKHSTRRLPSTFAPFLFAVEGYRARGPSPSVSSPERYAVSSYNSSTCCVVSSTAQLVERACLGSSRRVAVIGTLPYPLSFLLMAVSHFRHPEWDQCAKAWRVTLCLGKQNPLILVERTACYHCRSR